MINKIRAKLEKSINGCHIEVTNLPGGGNHNHLGMIVVSDSFQEIPLFEQHKQVMNILSDELKSELHAIKLKTMTFEKFNLLSE